MALTLPYTSIDQFVPTTVHSDVAHNAPHNRLIANDIAIRDYFVDIEAAIAAQSVQIDVFSIPAGSSGQISGTSEVVLASQAITFTNRPTLFLAQWTFYSDNPGQLLGYIKKGSTTLNAHRCTTINNNNWHVSLFAYSAAPGTGSIVVSACGSAWGVGQLAHVITDTSLNISEIISNPAVYVIQFT